MDGLDPEQTYLLTIPQVAKMLAMPKSTAYQRAQQGLAPFGVNGPIRVVPMGKSSKRCPKVDVVDYLNDLDAAVRPTPQ